MESSLGLVSGTSRQDRTACAAQTHPTHALKTRERRVYKGHRRGSSLRYGRTQRSRAPPQCQQNACPEGTQPAGSSRQAPHACGPGQRPRLRITGAALLYSMRCTAVANVLQHDPAHPCIMPSRPFVPVCGMGRVALPCAICMYVPTQTCHHATMKCNPHQCCLQSKFQVLLSSFHCFIRSEHVPGCLLCWNGRPLELQAAGAGCPGGGGGAGQAVSSVQLPARYQSR